MLEYIRSEANKAYTENGALTNKGTFSECLDFFAAVGAMRRRSEADIVKCFVRAFAEDKSLAVKILFYARDVRGGLGERRVFRTIMKYLANAEPETVRKNIEFISEFGRFDDLLCLLGTACSDDSVRIIAQQLKADMAAAKNGGEVSLLAKWLPSVNASSRETVKAAKYLAKRLKMSEADYRKALSALRAKTKIIENNLRERDYSFDYSKQPSKAMLKYRMAFIRNDKERYSEFLNSVSEGKASLNAGTLYPYELIEPFLEDWKGDYHNFLRQSVTAEELASLNTTWSALPDFCGGANALAVIDTSGSMFWENRPMPASVALSLGLYFGERNSGAFKNYFIMFSENPQLIEIKGETFAERLRYVCSFNEYGNTNIEAVFRLVLKAAVAFDVPQSELPEQLVIISDMEFDACIVNADLTNFENAKKLFEAHGYKLPRLVFWNVSARHRNMPVTKNEQGVILVSGCTPRIFSMVASSESISPYEFMLEALNCERYSKIAA